MNDLSIIEDLRARGLIFQVSGERELAAHLADASRTLYCGFDPTADSLHIGSLLPLLLLRRFQLAGHRPIALVGGATGLVGDPSFRDRERQLNRPDTVAGWVDSIRRQMETFVDFDCGPNSARVIDNLEWTRDLDVLTFLRDIGKHFSVNAMIRKESVKQRLERDDSGISFTEFTYMILQSMDFAELSEREGCSLQIGGSDQWGNITAGIDLTRRLHGRRVHGLTMPLLTKADGSKFGKTESGTIWLDARRTSPYAFYQFWLNTPDAEVYRYLRYFSLLAVAQIAELERDDQQRRGRPEAQAVLARETTRLVHGQAGLDAAQRITEALFSGTAQDLSESDFLQLRQDGLPCTGLNRAELAGTSVTRIFTEAGVADSGKQVKDALARGSVLINGLAPEDNMHPAACFAPERALHGRFYLARLGKKKYHLFELN